MADYYPVLARAVSHLSDNNAQARRELYDRARTIVIEQLRTRDPQELMPETAQEWAALEGAIRRVEAESRSAQPPGTSRHASVQAPPPVRRAARARPADRPAAKAQPKPAANYLAKILHALQPGGTGDRAAPKSDRAKTKKGDATAAARPKTIDDPASARPGETGELGGMLASLGTMMLALTYCVAALACTGVVYFRGSVMVSAGVIGYPILLLMTALVLALFVVPPWAFFRKSSALPTIGFLLRAIHSASREAS